MRNFSNTRLIDTINDAHLSMIATNNFSNSGTISIGSGGGYSSIGASGSTFSNSGSIAIGTGNSVVVQATVFVNSGTFSIAAGSTLSTLIGPTFQNSGTIRGSGSLSGTTFTNNGVIEASNGSLTISLAVTGTGNLKIDTGATLQLAANAAQTIDFNGVGTLALDTPSKFTGTIAGLAVGDKIDLEGVKAATANVAQISTELNAIVQTFQFTK